MAPRLLQTVFFLSGSLICLCAHAQQGSFLDLVFRSDSETDSEAASQVVKRAQSAAAVRPAAESSEDMPLLVSLVAYVLPQEAAHLPLLAAEKPRLKSRPVTRCLWSESSDNGEEAPQTRKN